MHLVGMRRITWLMMAMVGVSFGCRKDRQQNVELAAKADAAPSYGLESGETLWADNDEAMRRTTADWRPATAGDRRVYLYTVRLAPNKGALRAQIGDRSQLVETFTLKPGQPPTVTVTTVPRDRAVFQYGPASADAPERGQVALLLDWDEKAQEVRVLKRWQGGAGQRPPGWVRTGDVSLAPNALAQCERVARRISACAGDNAFREALFRRAGAERTSLERTFGAQSREWKDAARAKEQCQSWASDAYESTALSDADTLAELVKDTELDCAMFGRELDDEGGLPRRVAVARGDQRTDGSETAGTTTAPPGRRAQGRTPERR